MQKGYFWFMEVKSKSDNCLNCGAVLKSDFKFCSVCGQENKDRRLPLITLIKDFLGDYFNLDSKIFRSLIPLIFKPGFLTIEFNSGKRMKYIHPLRMYIFISIVYFFVAGITKPLSDNSDEQKQISNTVDTTADNLSVSLKTGMVNFSFSGSKFSYELDDLEDISRDEEKTKTFLDSMGLQKTPAKIFITKIFLRQVVKFKKQQESFSSYFMRNISIIMFFLMPLFAAIVMLIYRKTKRYYIEHLIFSFHFHSFVFLISIITEFADNKIMEMMVVSLTFTYLFIGLAKVYPQSFFRTLFRGMAVCLLYLAGLSVTMIITVVFSFLLF
jgi:hypothetical protein